MFRKISAGACPIQRQCVLSCSGGPSSESLRLLMPKFCLPSGCDALQLRQVVPVVGVQMMKAGAQQ